MPASTNRTRIAQLRRHLRNDRDIANVLQAIVSVGVAVAVSTAAILASMAAEHWQDSVTAEVRWSSAMALNTGHLFREEAPLAVEIVLMESRANALENAAQSAGKLGELASAEAQTLRGTARALVDAQTEDHLITGDTYRSGGGFDLGRRLADLEQQGGVGNTVTEEINSGERLATWALISASSAVVLVLLYVLTHATLAARRRQARRTAAAQGEDDDVGLVPHIWRDRDSRSGQRIVAFAAWLIVTLLPAAQINASLDEQRLQSRAARSAVEVSSMTQASTSYSGFTLSSSREPVVRSVLGLAREEWALAAQPESAVAQLVIARADKSNSADIEQILAEMTQLPDADDGVDAETIRRLTTTPEDWKLAVEVQGKQADTAQAAGRSAIQLAVAVLFAALALSIAILAEVMSRAHQRRLFGTSLAMVGASLLFAFTAVA